MARIIGVEVPPNKRIEIALRYIYGIGPSNAKVILAHAKIDPGIRAKDLTEQQLSQIVHAIQDGKYVIEGDLRREIGMNLKRLQGIKCYRGIRHLRVPTTVLAQGDSGVGVKNGINYLGRKNFLGTFAPPFAVLNDSRFLDAVGESGHFLSKHYDDFLADWRAVKHKKMRMDRAQIEGGAIGHLRLTP